MYLKYTIGRGGGGGVERQKEMYQVKKE